MSDDFSEFRGSEYSEMELEAFQEISNIGVGHSATAFAELLHRKVDMSIPHVNLHDLENLSEILGGSAEAIVSSILIDTELENCRLSYLLVFDEESTKNILRILRSNEPPENLEDLDEIGKSIITEAGNILLLHALTAINTFTESLWIPTIPQIAIDMAGSIFDEIIGREQIKTGKFLQIQCTVFTEDESLKGEIYIIPNPAGLKLLLDRLYGDGWEQY